MSSKELAKYRINIGKFLEEITRELLGNLRLGRVYFLLPDKKSGAFRTEFSTAGDFIEIMKRDIEIIDLKEREIFYLPHSYYSHKRMSLYENCLYRNLIRRLEEKRINMIVPLFLGDDLIGLIMLENNAKKEECHNINNLVRKIEFNLGSVLMYNWAIERAI